MLNTIDVNASCEAAGGSRLAKNGSASDDVAPNKRSMILSKPLNELKSEISKQVLRKKLAKQRHLVIEKAIQPVYLDSIFPIMLELFKPQNVQVSCALYSALFSAEVLRLIISLWYQMMH
jgi:hypothetical protein